MYLYCPKYIEFYNVVDYLYVISFGLTVVVQKRIIIS